MNETILKLLHGVDTPVTLHLYGLDKTNYAVLEGSISVTSWNKEAQFTGKGFDVSFNKEWVTGVSAGVDSAIISVIVREPVVEIVKPYPSIAPAQSEEPL